MSATSFKSVVSGATFGAALTAAGVYSPSIIMGQLQLKDFHMLKAFVAASASSAIAIIAAQKLNFTSCKPRTPASLNWFSTYDGNIVGGLLLGAGLALTGACPGTVLPQVATGVPSGPLVLVGGLLGGILYSKFGKNLQSKTTDKDALDKPTAYQKFGVEKTSGILLYEGMCFAIIAASEFLSPSGKDLLMPAAVGGLLIGASQGASLILTGNTLGVSTAYEQLGDLFWWAEKTLVEGKDSVVPSIRGNAFAVGTILGSFGISKLANLPPPSGEPSIGAFRAVFGGAVMLFGSRIAGGCTSGHGISGMSQLSISSIISVIAMFAGGIALTTIL